MGHEFSGEVIQVGQDVTDLGLGNRVTGNREWSCGKCYYCVRNKPALCVSGVYAGKHVNGCMAEYLVAPANTLHRLPDCVSYEIGALVEPLEVAFHAVRQGKVEVGNTVAIVGAGPIGCSTILAAKAAGASRILVSEYSAGRREMADEFGATAVIDPASGDPMKTIWDLTDGLGADVSFDCVGSGESPLAAIDFARKGGTAVIVGVFSEPCRMVNFNDISLTERTVVGSSGCANEASFVIEMVADGRLDPSALITDTIPLADTVRFGFKELIANKHKHMKILVQPSQ
jgi:(R,R)-butanediol dehydrogenase/meso-butanediol dehydrogenase/diacetyl reductase